jgi:hypothetical protein
VFWCLVGRHVNRLAERTGTVLSAPAFNFRNIFAQLAKVEPESYHCSKSITMKNQRVGERDIKCE